MSRNYWILLIACLTGGVGAVFFGFALEWDMLNYQLYNPHALLNGRIAIDMVPAQKQTYLNPLLHLPPYLVFRYLNSETVLFITGAIQGSQLLLLLLILEELTGQVFRSRWLLLPVAVLGLAGLVFLNELGGSRGDTLLSVLVLASLLLVLRDFNRTDSTVTMKTGLLSGLLLGVATALKLTMVFYAIGLGFASLLYFSGFRRWRMTSGLALGGLLGLLLAGGPWFLYMWQQYQNPLFPYFNNVFESSWVPQVSSRDLRFIPRTVTEWLFYPVYWFLDPKRVWEFEFRDLRVPVLITLVFLMPLFCWNRMRTRVPALGLVWLFVACSYILWILLFSIYRYLSVIELLAPAVIFSSLLLLDRSRRLAVLLLCALITTQLLVKYKRNAASWEFQYDTATALSELPADAMLVIDGYHPISYAALWLDDDIPLVRIRANFMRTSDPRFRLHELAHQKVLDHSGPHYLLMPQLEAKAAFKKNDLAAVGLFLGDVATCREVFDSKLLQRRLGLKLCPLQKMSARSSRTRGY